MVLETRDYNTPWVDYLRNPKKGRLIRHQFIINCIGYKVFQSYITTLAVKFELSGKLIIDPQVLESKSSLAKYLRQFTGKTVPQMRIEAKKGLLEIRELNPKDRWKEHKMEQQDGIKRT